MIDESEVREKVLGGSPKFIEKAVTLEITQSSKGFVYYNIKVRGDTSDEAVNLIKEIKGRMDELCNEHNSKVVK